jgi:hypothetical protein
MLHGAKRRISALERSIALPVTAERFLASVQERVRLTGASFEEAGQSLLASLSVETLDRLADELLQLACGDDMEARNEVMRRAEEMAASNP